MKEFRETKLDNYQDEFKDKISFKYAETNVNGKYCPSFCNLFQFAVFLWLALQFLLLWVVHVNEFRRKRILNLKPA